MNLWNLRNLEAPPTNTYKIHSNIELHKLIEIFRITVIYFKNQNLLSTEAALLSRCIYRMKMKFRSDKGLKSMEKLNKVLLQYLRLDFIGIVTNFYELLPQKTSPELYAPTRNMLDFILVRLQGLGMLMTRAVETAQIAAHSMEYKVSIGNFWKVAFIAFSLVSRIWLICKQITRFSCKLFSELLPLRNLLENVGNRWLPDDYMFPDDLQKWLNIDWLNENDSVVNDKKIAYSNVVKYDSDVEISAEYTEIDDDLEIVNEYKRIVLNDTNELTEINKNVKFGPMCDIKEVIENNRINEKTCQNRQIKREKKSKVRNVELNEPTEARVVGQHRMTESCIKNKRKNNIVEPKQVNKIQKINVSKNIGISTIIKKKGFHIDHIDSPECLRKFIKCEEKRRNVNVQICATKNLDKLQWNMLQKSLKSCLKKAEKNKDNVSQAASYLSKARDFLKISLC